MENFAAYLQSLPYSPLTEAVATLYEGLTKSDVALGKYLKSFNKGVNMQWPQNGLPPNERAAFVFLARNHVTIADLLDIGATYGIPQGGDDEFDETDAEISIQQLVRKVGDQDSERRNLGLARSAEAEIAYIYEHYKNDTNVKAELKKAADLYRNGQCDRGYTALKDALGIYFDYFVHPLTRIWNDNDAYSDDKVLLMNPDISQHLLRNRWLLHETSVEAGLSILKNGFDRGNLAGDLAMTTVGKHYQTGDYLFAHDAVDMLSHERYQSRSFGSYGNFALVFRGSGYKAYHSLDEENQVMFDYHEPKSFFVILYHDDAEEAGFPVKKSEYEDYDYAVYGRGKNGLPSVVYANSNAYSCLEWILRHGDDYRNVMFRVP